jgi:hypothetical protein
VLIGLSNYLILRYIIHIKNIMSDDSKKNEITDKVVREAAKAAGPLLDALREAAGQPPKVKQSQSKEKKL